MSLARFVLMWDRRIPSVFVGQRTQQLDGTPNAFTLPTGTQGGDLVLIYMQTNGAGPSDITGGDGGWTRGSFSFSSNSVYFWKQVTEADVAASLALDGSSDASALFLTYRNGSTITRRTAGGGTGDLSVTGFTKSPNARALIYATSGVNEGGNPTLLAGPSGFTQRVDGGNMGYPIYAGDMLTVAGYTNDAAFTATWTGASAPQMSIFEIT